MTDQLDLTFSQIAELQANVDTDILVAKYATAWADATGYDTDNWALTRAQLGYPRFTIDRLQGIRVERNPDDRLGASFWRPTAVAQDAFELLVAAGDAKRRATAEWIEPSSCAVYIGYGFGIASTFPLAACRAALADVIHRRNDPVGTK